MNREKVYTVMISMLILMAMRTHNASAAEVSVPLPNCAAEQSYGLQKDIDASNLSGAVYQVYAYQVKTNSSQILADRYIALLEEFGFYVIDRESERYDDADDANYGVLLRDGRPEAGTFSLPAEKHGWKIEDVSAFLEYSTGGPYDTQYFRIYFARDSYQAEEDPDRPVFPDAAETGTWLFYREQLNSDKEKQVYDLILYQLLEREERIDLSSVGGICGDDFFPVWYAVLIDHPEIFWISDDPNYTTEDSDGTVMTIIPEYAVTSAQFSGYKRKWESAVDAAMRVVKPGMSEYDKELALHDWLCKRIVYDYNQTRPLRTTSYGSLVNRIAVCEGYAEAMTVLLRRAGIMGATVYGFYNDIGHAWNIVRIDGQWYYIDPTFDDSSSEIDYSWFNITTKQLEKDHVLGIGRFPECDSTDAKYHGVK